MKKHRISILLSRCILLGCLLMGCLLTFPGNIFCAENQGRRLNPEPERFVTIDFNNVDINVLIKFISELSGRNFVVDNRVKGKVTIISPKKISVKEAYRVFESVLEVHGFTTIKAGKITKIIPAPDARSKNIETRLKKESGVPEDKVVTQLISLTYANADEVKRLFSPLISKSSVMLAYAPTNILIVTDVYSNILRLMRIVKAIDVGGMGQEITILPLKYADAGKAVKTLSSIFKVTKKTAKGVTPKTLELVADERTNAIVVLASEIETIRIKALLALLDKEVPKGEEKLRVYYLENANAEDLAKVLQTILSKQTGQVKKGKKEPALVSEGVRITADKATNSLIIMAQKEDYAVLEDIIKQLDIPRLMVYLETLIMEVNVDKDFNLGVEWQAGGTSAYQGKDIVYGGGSGKGGSIPGLSAVTYPLGLSLGIIGDGITAGGVTFPSIAAFINAHQKDKDVHILSTPQILTKDNEEAKIYVGKNVPFQTRSGSSSASTDVYTSYEYKDVGITLKITPQISKDRLVSLKIAQEISKLDELATNTDDRPTTLKRTIDTTVVVKDKNTIVIGGLIDTNATVTVNKVPLLGDIPLLGALFRSTSRASEKTNLFIFLTPHVLYGPEEATDFLNSKKEHIKRIEEGNVKLYKEFKTVIPENEPAPEKPSAGEE
ncbi:MAG: type II secretion system secretin GspD [Desulfobacterales bacterium]|nr:type II secretion system secretin GspD [Desulfobacterales bacterium]